MDLSRVSLEGILTGALLGLIMKSLYDRLLTALRLNRLRRVILDYSVFIGLDKSSQYIKDMKHIKRYMEAEDEDEISGIQSANYGVDEMPMFTSDIFKSFSQDELRRVAFNTKNYISLLDIYYSIDFLRKYMPFQLWEKYHRKLRIHIEEKQIEGEIKHLKECGYLKSLAREAINEVEAKMVRAEATLKQFCNLINNLRGLNLFWIIKYSFILDNDLK